MHGDGSGGGDGGKAPGCMTRAPVWSAIPGDPRRSKTASHLAAAGAGSKDAGAHSMPMEPPHEDAGREEMAAKVVLEPLNGRSCRVGITISRGGMCGASSAAEVLQAARPQAERVAHVVAASEGAVAGDVVPDEGDVNLEEGELGDDAEGEACDVGKIGRAHV